MPNEPPVVLDATGRDIQGEGAVLRARGPVLRVQLPGGVPAWAVGRFDVLRRLPRGDAIIVSYAAAGRDDRAYGETADEFDITRPDKRHHSFGHGVHHCVGAPLARLEARIALPAIFARFPELSLAVPASELTPLRSFLTNGHTSLPVRLTRQGGSSAG